MGKCWVNFESCRRKMLFSSFLDADKRFCRSCFVFIYNIEKEDLHYLLDIDDEFSDESSYILELEHKIQLLKDLVVGKLIKAEGEFVLSIKK